MNLIDFYPLLRFDSLAISLCAAVLFFTLLIAIYSFKFLKGKVKLADYYSLLLITSLTSCLVILANHLILLLIAWGFLGFTLYALIILNQTNQAAAAAKKTLIIIGAADSIMILGIALVFYLSNTLQMDRIQIPLRSVASFAPTLAYLCLAVAAFAKAGAMPVHSWIPDCATHAFIPVTAYLPAALDKLLGIYLLFRISTSMFVMSQAMNTFLMAIGSLTIIAAVMMALIQHDIKRLLGYHAVSQVGYMVLGIGTGSALGIAGGLFHMFNHAIYKSCLFLCAGNVETKAKTSDLDRLGGLARFMPVSFFACVIASLSISGVPPFNGFFSKWMIYQALIEMNASGDKLWVVWLTIAMFGSGLTLASFMKLLHAVFLGQQAPDLKGKVNEVSWSMWLPVSLLALVCVIFGIFAVQLPLKVLILPAVGGATGFIGSWYSGLAAFLLLVGLLIGIAISQIKTVKVSLRQDEPFVGGEKLALAQTRVTGTEFYDTIKEMPILEKIYKRSQAGLFDIYEQGKVIAFVLGRFFQYLHNGILPTYLVWTLLGMIVLFFILAF